MAFFQHVKALISVLNSWMLSPVTLFPWAALNYGSTETKLKPFFNNKQSNDAIAVAISAGSASDGNDVNDVDVDDKIWVVNIEA